MSVRRETRRDPKTGAVREFWMVDVDFVHPDGHEVRKRRVSPVQTRRGAEQYERELREVLLTGREEKEVVPTRTFGEFADEYLAGKVGDGAEVKPAYLQYMRYTIAGHLKRAFGDTALADITTAKVDEFRRSLKAPRKSGRINGDKSVNNVLALLAKILRTAMARKLIAEVPEVIMLKRDDKARRGRAKIKADGQRCYTDAQFGVAVGASREVSPAAYLVWLLGGDHGLRRGEMMSLKWSDIDFASNTLTVNTSVWLLKGKRYEGTPKGGSIRELDMTPALVEALKKTKRNGVYLLSELTTYSKFRKVIEEVQAHAGFPVTGKAHVLRHTFCSRLALKGVPVKVIQTLAGHANIETTERYLHSDREQERQAMALLHRAQTSSEPTAT